MRRCRFLSGLLAGMLLTASMARAASWNERERQAEQLRPVERIDAYRDLRRDLIDSADQEQTALQLERIEAKLALAYQRRATPEPNARERRQMAYDAARIGTLYVKAGDPESAVAYEQVVESIEPSSPSTTLLRNAVRDWFGRRLDERLDARQWPPARELLHRWAELLPGDPSTEAGREKYAQVRAQVIRGELGAAKAEAALEALAEEEAALGQRDAWAAARAEIRDGLVAAVRAANAGLNQREMQDAIDRLRRLFPDDERVPELQKDYEDLVRRLAPLPITRPYGRVANAGLRLSAAGYLGTTTCEVGTSELTEDSNVGFLMEGQMRWLRTDDRDRIGPWFYGVGGQVTYLDVSQGEETATVMIAAPELQLGWRGSRATATIGAGMSYQTYDFEGQVVNVDGTATSLLDLSLAGEYALAESFAVRGRLNYSGASDIELLGAQAGLRYYPSPNFAVALGYRFLNSTLKADAFGPDMSVEAAGLTAELLLQF